MLAQLGDGRRVRRSRRVPRRQRGLSRGGDRPRRERASVAGLPPAAPARSVRGGAQGHRPARAENVVYFHEYLTDSLAAGDAARRGQGDSVVGQARVDGRAPRARLHGDDSVAARRAAARRHRRGFVGRRREGAGQPGRRRRRAGARARCARGARDRHHAVARQRVVDRSRARRAGRAAARVHAARARRVGLRTWRATSAPTMRSTASS